MSDEAKTLLSDINRRIKLVRKGKLSRVVITDHGYGHITVAIVPYEEPKQKQSWYHRIKEWF